MTEKKPRKKKSKGEHQPDLASVDKALADLPEGYSIIGVQGCPCGDAIIVYIPKPDMIEAENGQLVPSAHMPVKIAMELANEIMGKCMSAVMRKILGDVEPGHGQ